MKLQYIATNYIDGTRQNLILDKNTRILDDKKQKSACTKVE